LAKSEGVGQGSEFEVRLPAQGGAPATSGASGAPRSPRAGSAVAPRRLLVVDDNADAANLLTDMLAELGFEVKVALDGISALATAQAYRPDAVLLDIGLPVMDGYEVASCMRRVEGLSSVKLIAVTGWGQETDRRRSVEAGFDEHLVKPVEMEQICEVIKRLLPVGAGHQ